MANSVVEIWNMALGDAQVGGRVSTLTDTSKIAADCRTYYDDVRQTVLSAAPWECALSYASLPLVKERDYALDWTDLDPAPGFAYAYGLPANYLAPFYLYSFARFEVTLYQPDALTAPFRALMTNDASPILRYVRDQETVAYWSPTLVQAVTKLLAYKLCPVSSAKLGLRDRLLDEYFTTVLSARTTLANGEEMQMETLPPSIAARGYSGSGQSAKYFYPFNNTNSGTV